MTAVSDKHQAMKRNRGFTLLEVMISVSILTIGFFAIYSLFLQSLSASEEARFMQKASFLATLKESAWGQDPSELSQDEGDFGSEYPGWRWSLVPSKLENEEFETVVKRLTRVRLEVFRDGGKRRYGVTHYLFVTEAP
ncbi:prepilin-type N-terminal cleavage/methylation domain-containing protein [Desulfoluna sp.]|uniref:type IV pilus modification PilV family protein n=1 Tax=Desulfoluna sp. TaxID=2045199 RepID=UPI002610FA92|nr:prepilin-type N-terminal cleavage/methylation domain-containing protein [Desulfoluna sp.]